MASTPIPLSSSVGGAPTFLTDNTLPGLLIHENPAGSGVNHLVVDILVVNPNSTAVTLWTTIQGPGITPPQAKSQTYMVRIDVPPTAEGNEPRVFYTPFILEPGYSYHISTEVLTGQEPAYLFGYVEVPDTSGGAGVSGVGRGYGGLITISPIVMPDVPASTYGQVPFEANLLDPALNVEQDYTNNRFRILSPGYWTFATYAVIELKKKNTDRLAYFRFRNQDTGQPFTPFPFPVPIENNENFAQWGISTIVEVDNNLVGDWFELQFGDGQEFQGAPEALQDITIAKAGIDVIKITDLPT